MLIMIFSGFSLVRSILISLLKVGRRFRVEAIRIRIRRSRERSKVKNKVKSKRTNKIKNKKANKRKSNKIKMIYNKSNKKIMVQIKVKFN